MACSFALPPLLGGEKEVKLRTHSDRTLHYPGAQDGYGHARSDPRRGAVAPGQRPHLPGPARDRHTFAPGEPPPAPRRQLGPAPGCVRAAVTARSPAASEDPASRSTCRCGRLPGSHVVFSRWDLPPGGATEHPRRSATELRPLPCRTGESSSPALPRLARRRGAILCAVRDPVVQRPSTPPFQGGDRGFESPQGRQLTRVAGSPVHAAYRERQGARGRPRGRLRHGGSGAARHSEAGSRPSAGQN